MERGASVLQSMGSQRVGHNGATELNGSPCIATTDHPHQIGRSHEPQRGSCVPQRRPDAAKSK